MATISANGSRGHHKFTLTVNEISTNTQDNTSTVSFSFTLSPIQTGWNWNWAQAPVHWRVVIGEKNNSLKRKTYTGDIGYYDGSSTVTLLSGNQVINHNEDGSGEAFIYFEVWETSSASYLPGNAIAETSFALTKIARVARIGAIEYSSQTELLENPFRVYYQKYSNSYNYKLRISIPNVIALETINNYASNTWVSLSQATINYLYNYTQNSNEVTLGYVIETYSGSTKIGESDEMMYPMPIQNAKPAITSATAVDVNSATIALTGSSNTIVKGYSNLKISDIVASAYKGATLKSIIIDDVSATYTSGYTKTINGYTKNNVAIKVVDSRSKTSDTITKLFSFVDYLPITKIGMTVSRSSSGVGEGVTLALNGKWFNKSFGKVTNTLSVMYRFKETTASSWTTGATTLNVAKTGDDFSINQSIRGDLSTGFNVDKSYNLEVIFTDKLSTATFATIIGTGSPAIAIKGNKIALGGKFDDSLGLDVQFRKCPFPIGYIYLSMSNENPSKFFGGTWTQITNRFLYCTTSSKGTGGSTTTGSHTLTTSEMPVHSHGLKKNVPYGIPYNNTGGATTGGGSSPLYGESYSPFSIENAGGGGGHTHPQNLPPYMTCYAWYRTA